MARRSHAETGHSSVRQSLYRAALALLGTLGTWVSPGLANLIVVYAGEPGRAVILPEGTSTIDLFISSGTTASSSGTPCVDGNGDELCAWSLRIEGKGEVSIESFTPDVPSETVWNLQPNVLRANGGDRLNGRLGPERIGALTLNLTGYGAIEVVQGEGSMAVGADLGLEEIPNSVIAVPEPGRTSMLVAGVAFLYLAGRRRRHAGR